VSDNQKIAIFENKPVKLIKDKFFNESLTNMSFQHHTFRDTGAKKLIFKGCDFSYCIFDRAYFHACEFDDCNFTGVRFIDSNLRNTIFNGCKFEYAIFKSTLVSHHQMLKNLPAWPNVQRELLRTLRINAENIGDAESVKEFVRYELAASREHLKKAREGKESYYSKKYKGFWNKIKIYWESMWLWIDWHLWGHGEYPEKLLGTIVGILFVLTFFRLITDNSLNGESTFYEIFSLSLDYLLQNIYAFVGIIPDEFPKGLAALLALTRYVSLGLFISVLYKRLARR